MKLICTMSIGLLGLFTAAATAEPVLAPVIESTGAASGSPKAGGTIATGTNLKTGASGRLSLNPFPGAVVSLGSKTEATITKLDMSKQGGAVTRQATVQLKEGSLMFAVDKVNWATTQCQIASEKGTISAERPEAGKTASAGLVSMHDGVEKVVVLAGGSSYTLPGGQKIALASGSVLSNGKNGLSVINLTTGQETSYDASGAAGETRTASPEAMKSASSAYGEGVAHSQTLVASGALSAETAAAVTETLTAVNQQLAVQGVEPVSGDQVGSLAAPASGGGSGAVAASLPSLSGMGGAGGANPANTKGIVRSSEK